MADEFELIERFFTTPGVPGDGVSIGVGDDAAVLEVPPGCTVVDAMSLHAIPPEADGFAFGTFALEDAISRLHTRGARARWITLALTLPEADEDWLEGLSRAVRDAERKHCVRLVGGDTTRGPGALSVSVFALQQAEDVQSGDADRDTPRARAEGE